jgi:tRNA (guanine-N7-)-methyltransferase
MSFGLGRGKPLDPALGVVAVSDTELPPLPDSIGTDPLAGRLDPRVWFPRPDRPFEVEIGSGKGTFLIQEAERRPEANFLGIEWAKEFCDYFADRVRRRRAGLADDEKGPDALDEPPPRALMNVRTLHTDAAEFLRWRVPDAIVRVIHLYFSDPWPKSRHHRRRVVQDRFLATAARVMPPGGELRVVTDHAELWAWDIAHFADWCRDPSSLLPAVGEEARADVEANRREFPRDAALVPRSPTDRPFELIPFVRPTSAGDGELVGTNFERKYRREGRPFNAIILRRT